MEVPHHPGEDGSAVLDLYHRTTTEAAQAILQGLSMTSRENTAEAYFSTFRDGGEGEGYGTAVVHIRVPEHMAEIDDVFPSGEEHYRVKVRDLRPEHFVTGSQRTAGPAGNTVPLGTFPVRQPTRGINAPRDVKILRMAEKDIQRLHPGQQSLVRQALEDLRQGRANVEPKSRPPLIGVYTIRVTGAMRIGLYLTDDQPGGDPHPDWVVFWVGAHNYEEAERRMRLNGSRHQGRLCNYDEDLHDRGVREAIACSGVVLDALEPVEGSRRSREGIEASSVWDDDREVSDQVRARREGRVLDLDGETGFSGVREHQGRRGPSAEGPPRFVRALHRTDPRRGSVGSSMPRQDVRKPLASTSGSRREERAELDAHYGPIWSQGSGVGRAEAEVARRGEVGRKGSSNEQLPDDRGGRRGGADPSGGTTRVGSTGDRLSISPIHDDKVYWGTHSSRWKESAPSAWGSMVSIASIHTPVDDLWGDHTAKIHVPDDPSRYGDTNIRYELGGNGPVMDPRDLPATVYHVTTAGSRVGGVLRADFEMGGGLGGNSGEDRSVSFTVDRGVAQDIAGAMRLMALAAREFQRTGRGRAFYDVLVGLSADEGWAFDGDGRGWLDVYNSWDFGDWMSFYFNRRSSKAGKRNPLFFGVKVENWARVNPDDVGYVTATKDAIIASGAMVTDFDLGSGSYGLQEIRVWGDVAVGGFTRSASSRITYRVVTPEEEPWIQDDRTMVRADAGAIGVGHLIWDSRHGGPMIEDVWVRPEYRRQGIATKMLERAREIEPELSHSTMLTGDGSAWSQAVASHRDIARMVQTYPSVHGGKYHARRDPISEVARCRSTILLDVTAMPTMADPNGKNHPIVCPRCMAAVAKDWQKTASDSLRYEYKPSVSELGGLITTIPEVVAYDGGREVGSLSWDHRDPTLFGTVRVDPRYRRRGIATRLWEEAKAVNPVLDPESSVFYTPDGRAFVDSLSRTASAGLTFTHHPKSTLGDDGQMEPYDATDALAAHDASGRVVGYIAWYVWGGLTNHGVDHIYVDPAYRRQGLATELYQRAKQINPDINLMLTPWFTPDGAAFVRSQGFHVDAAVSDYWYHFGSGLERYEMGEYVHLGTRAAAEKRHAGRYGEGNFRHQDTMYRAKIRPRNPLNSPSNPLTDHEANGLTIWEDQFAVEAGQMPQGDEDVWGYGHDKYPGWILEVAKKYGYQGAWKHDAIYYRNDVEDPGSISVAIDPDCIIEQGVAPPANPMGEDQLLLWATRKRMAAKEEVWSLGDLRAIRMDKILNPEQVDKYLADIRAGQSLPPVFVERGPGGDFLSDGHHRLEAAREAGLADLRVLLFEDRWEATRALNEVERAKV